MNGQRMRRIMLKLEPGLLVSDSERRLLRAVESIGGRLKLSVIAEGQVPTV